MGFAHPDGDFHRHFGPLNIEDIVPCDQFRDGDFSSYHHCLDTICESQESTATGSDGYTSSQDICDSGASSSRATVDLQQQVDLSTELLAHLENSIGAVRTDSEWRSQTTNSVCADSAIQLTTVPETAFDVAWHGPEGANVFYRQVPSWEATALSSAAQYTVYDRGADAISMSQDMRQPSLVILSPAQENVKTTACQPQSAPDPAPFGYSVQTQPHAATYTAEVDVNQPHTTVLPSMSELVDVATTYLSERAVDSSASVYPVQNEPYDPTSNAESDVDQARKILPMASGILDRATLYNVESAIGPVVSGSYVQTEPCVDTSTVPGHLNQGSAVTHFSASESIDTTPYPTLSSFDPVTSGYYNQIALSAHLNAANSYYTGSYHPAAPASSDLLYSRAAIPRNQVPQPSNAGWGITSAGTFPYMIPQGITPVSTLYPSMDIATGGGPQRQMAGLELQYPLYAQLSAVGMATTGRSQSTFVGAAHTGNGTPGSSTSTYRSQQIYMPVPFISGHSQPIARTDHGSHLERSNTLPSYSQSPDVFPPHWSFSAHARATSSSLSPRSSSSSSGELLPDHDTNVPLISGAVRTKDTKNGKGKGKAKKPYTPKPAPAVRRTQSDASATRFHQWDPSQLNRKLSSTPESDASGSSYSSSGRGGRMPKAVKCLWEGCDGPSFTERGKLRAHIHTHTGPSNKNQRKCLWGGCTGEMQTDSVVRHIIFTHASDGSAMCLACWETCCRNDSVLRHRRNSCRCCMLCGQQFLKVDERVTHENQCLGL